MTREFYTWREFYTCPCGRSVISETDGRHFAISHEAPTCEGFDQWCAQQGGGRIMTDLRDHETGEVLASAPGRPGAPS